MVYKIVWASGDETAERYSTKSLAINVLKSSNFKGKIVKCRLGNPGRTSPFQQYTYGGKIKNYPKGKKLHWIKIPTSGGYVYRTHVKN